MLLQALADYCTPDLILSAGERREFSQERAQALLDTNCFVPVTEAAPAPAPRPKKTRAQEVDDSAIQQHIGGASTVP